MSKKNFTAFAALATLAVLEPDVLSNPSTAYNTNPTLSLPPEDFEEPQPGQKTYFFNDLGEFDNNKMRRDECVFKCFALNDKNAIKKFNKFKSAQTGVPIKTSK